MTVSLPYACRSQRQSRKSSLLIVKAQYIRAIISNGHCMFKMSRQGSIGSNRSPSVFQHPDLGSSEGEHRLDGQNHSSPQGKIHGTVRNKVRDFRFFMEVQTDSVPNKALYYRIPSGFGMLLNGSGNIDQIIPWSCFPDSFHKSCPGCFHKRRSITRNFTDCKGPGCIAIIFPIHNPHVEGDDVSFLEDPVRRKAVNDFFVDRATKGEGKTLIPFECRSDIIFSALAQSQFFKEHGRHARFNFPADCVENFCYDAVGFAHQLDFSGTLNMNTAEFFHKYYLPLIFAPLLISPSYCLEMVYDSSCPMKSMATPTTMSNEVPPK